ncbi:heavy-metal-associated domain-containing protein [Pseudorhodoferax sp. Leaf267]|uniref:heavy-metal-associated domain-containing protein n=1 Tax=Pseudorhodoferax sp. Leaf267 TaxID=1736316 RepID=UPI0006FE5891|nr:heavy-metal-associated domain-containing protein [Pseudorhodoferax sp. Leaf267]KQP22720.1 heavy metal transporter [Pseudorhodoferax sp. Leaf267]
MIAFEVQDMSCGHCVGSITKAVQAVDPQARVEIDLPTHRVQITPAQADAAQLRDAITQAGFTPVPA